VGLSLWLTAEASALSPQTRGCSGDSPSNDIQAHALPENIFLLKIWNMLGMVI